MRDCSKAKRWGRQAAAWLFPERCIFCNRVIPPLTLSCEECKDDLSVIVPPLCPLCGASKADCACERHRHRFDRVAAPFYSEGAVHSGLVRLKRFDDPYAIGFFADQMAAVCRREYSNEALSVVTSVPMTASKRYERGYNQGERLAQAVAERLALPYVALLAKIYETRAQKTLHAWERAGNVLGVFDVPNPEAVCGKTVLLVDDLVTTAATADECAKMLKLYGAQRVLLLTAGIRRMGESAPKTASNG